MVKLEGNDLTQYWIQRTTPGIALLFQRWVVYYNNPAFVYIFALLRFPFVKGKMEGREKGQWAKVLADSNPNPYIVSKD